MTLAAASIDVLCNLLPNCIVSLFDHFMPEARDYIGTIGISTLALESLSTALLYRFIVFADAHNTAESAPTTTRVVQIASQNL